ncbi:centrosome and spindle pole associated protein 1-like isoform X2 [Branchiostoma lanceolatum]|uniref:centrosome and spindle pole associated protein 1-like isoform X2 n=1 Tax=Branchiostoma lanceolatum TaxID=7740 RepID=UPI003451DB85
MSDDIEKFIEQQKQKITAERQELGIPADPDISPSHGVNNGPSKENIPPTQGSKRDSGGPVEFGGLKLGGYEDHRKKLQEERKREYNQLLNEKKFRSTGVNSRIQEIEHAKSLPRSSSEPQGLNNDQGSRTYPQRRRDTSPLGKETYDDILKRKREEEDRYRRLDDPEMITDRRRDDRLRDHPLRASRSDGFLNEPDDRRHRSESGWLKGLGHDRLKCELCQRRARLSGEWDQDYDRKVNRLDDDYGSRHVRFRDRDDYVDEDRRDWSRSRAGRRRDLNSAEGERPSREKDDKDRAHSAPPEDGFVIEKAQQSTFFTGNQERASAVRRKKDAYRQDLMRQMADNERARKKEKSRDMRINASGENDPEKLTSVPEEEPGRIRDLPPTNRQPNRQRGRDTSPYRPYHTLDDEPEGRDRRQDRQRTPPYRPQQAFATPPPQPQRGLGPQPMGYMQPGVVPANPYFMGAPMIPVAAPLGPYRTPYDDAYYYYGMRHPLDPNIGGAGGPVPPTGGPVPPLTTLANGRSDSLPVPSINIPNVSPRGPEFTREDAARKRTESRIQDMVADDDTRKSQEAIEKQRQYQEDLKEQMRLRDLKKQKERDEKERIRGRDGRYDRKLEAEAQNYNPWGKGGGGAPLRNSDGRVVADLRKMHIQNEEDQLSPRNEYSDKPVVNLEVNMASLTEPPRQPPIKESQDPDAITQFLANHNQNVGNRTQYPGHDGGSGSNNTSEALNMYTYKSPFARKNKVFEDEDNEQKNQRDEYQSELQRQVEEKKRRQEEEKRKQKEEEDREERRLAEQRERMQQEYEAEQRKQRDKEEEVKRKNEELKQLAEERRQEVERKKREEDEKHDQERRRQLDEEDRRRREEQQRQRVSSPPIPTLRKNEEEIHQPPPDSYRERPPPSPPVPAVRTRERAPAYQGPAKELLSPTPSTPAYLERVRELIIPPDVFNNDTDSEVGTVTPSVNSRESSGIKGRLDNGRSRVVDGNPHDVIDQLSAMRAQLQSEQRRVQSQLDHAKFDSVPAPKPQPPPPRRELTGVDIFDMARNRSRVAVRRPVQTADTSADPRNLEDFNDLKHRKNTVSRQEFRSRYPDDPYTARGLEAQQYAMLQQQEEKLGKLRQGGLASEMPNMGPRDLGLQRGDDLSRKSLLDSESAFIDTNGIQSNSDLNGEATFPPDMVDERKGPTARERRRQQRKSPSPHLLEKDELSLGGDSYLEAQPGPSGTQPGNFGSLTSLDVDRVAAKNEERLRRLKTLQGDDQSIGDPDDILQRFMNQQKHNRPSSTTTLDTEAWLRPGTGNTSLLSKT